MKKILLNLSAILLSVCSMQQAQAQCEPVVTPNNLILCPNTTDTLWSDIHDTYQWMKDGTPVAGANDQYYVLDGNLDPGSLFSVITNTTGCIGADTSDEVLVDGWVFLLPFVINVTNIQLCPGTMDSVMFDFSLDSNVQWYLNGSPIAGATNDTLVVYAPGLYTAEGAPDVCPNFVMPLGVDMDVTINEPPVVTPAFPEICPGTFVVLTTPVQTYDSFQWFMNGQPIINSNIGSFITFDPGFFHVTTDEDGCILSSDSVQAILHTPIVPVISLVGNELVSTPGGSQLSGFQWYLNGVAIPGATDSTYTPTAGGNYTVSGSDGTCTDTSTAFAHTVSVKNVVANISFKLYPNPAQDDIYINSAEAVSVILLDNVGRVVYSNAIADKEHHLSLHHLAKGIYTIKLTNEQGSAYEKIVVE